MPDKINPAPKEKPFWQNARILLFIAGIILVIFLMAQYVPTFYGEYCQNGYQLAPDQFNPKINTCYNKENAALSMATTIQPVFPFAWTYFPALIFAALLIYVIWELLSGRKSLVTATRLIIPDNERNKMFSSVIRRGLQNPIILSEWHEPIDHVGSNKPITYHWKVKAYSPDLRGEIIRIFSTSDQTVNPIIFGGQNTEYPLQFDYTERHSRRWIPAQFVMPRGGKRGGKIVNVFPKVPQEDVQPTSDDSEEFHNGDNEESENEG